MNEISDGNEKEKKTKRKKEKRGARSYGIDGNDRSSVFTLIST